MQHAGIPLDSLEITEHLLRASNCLLVNGLCLELALYSVKMGNRGFMYTLGEPWRVGKDFQSLRTATFVAPRILVERRRDAIQHIGNIRQSHNFVQGALEFLRRNPAMPDKRLIPIDSTFAYSEQAEPHL